MAFTNYIQQITATNGTTHDLVDTSASHYVKGTQTASTNVWTGALPDGVTAYYDGLSIDYFLPYAGTSTAATLNLGGKGAKPVYQGNSPTSGAVTTHYPVNSVIHMTYIVKSDINSGNGAWIVSAYYNTNSNTIPSAWCGTAAATAAKTADCSNFTLLSKSYIHVLIRYANTSQTALTLNINGTGAKTIYINGTASSTSNYTLPAGTYLVYYNGTNYYFRTDGKITSADGILTANTGTVTQVTAGTGLSIGSTAGGNFTTSGTINHTNSVTAQSTQAIYPIKIDAQGHISAYGTAVTPLTSSSTLDATKLSGTIPSGCYTNTWNAMTGATSSANGTVGYINAAPPKDGYNTKYWRADGTWAVPPDNNTDTKVTSSANHYTPATASGNDKTASASGATAAWSIDVVKGITINTDGKGHITGLSVTSGKIPANPNTNTTYTLSGALSSHKFTSTLTAGGSGSGTSTSDFTLAAGTGITITDDTTNRKMTIACSVTDTDTKVTQAYSTASSSYPLLMTATAGTSSTASRGATTAILNNGLYYTPSSQKLTVGSSVKISGWTWDGTTTSGHLSLIYS